MSKEDAAQKKEQWRREILLEAFIAGVQSQGRVIDDYILHMEFNIWYEQQYSKKQKLTT